MLSHKPQLVFPETFFSGNDQRPLPQSKNKADRFLAHLQKKSRGEKELRKIEEVERKEER